MTRQRNSQCKGLLLGVDGGGSKTLALVADLEGHILGRGLAGASNFNFIGIEATIAALDRAMSAALTQAGTEGQAMLAAVVGLAGAQEPADQAPFAAWLSARYPAVATRVVHDTDLVLAGGTPDGWGVAIVSGTGAIVHGCTPEGQIAYASGWGYLLGNEGSGYAIGLRALQATVRAHDGRGPRTALVEPILAQWSLGRVEDLIQRVYRENASVADIAALAPVVLRAAADGDAVAKGIAEDAGNELALAVMAAISRLRWTSAIPCAQAGSILLHGQAVAAAFLARVAELRLPLDPIKQVPEPALGALRLAQRLLR
jgi:N-acetylglucosamine kinase-like BadF-type ATPase